MRTLTELDGETRVVGVIGWPVKHSLSPAMQNAAIDALGLNWAYVPFEVSPTRLEGAIESVRALNLVGLNVTVPHKAGVARLVDELGETAQALGAVNTVRNQDGTLIGHNTDGEGFLRSLREIGEDVGGKRVAIIGAGGSARAVALAVARDEVGDLQVINRTVSRAAEVVRLVRDLTPAPAGALALDSPAAEDAVRQANIVIDCTPCGMHPNVDEPPAIPEEWIQEGQTVCDLVYTPRETTLLRAARRRNARTLDGSGMLVYQGAIALELWTRQAAPVQVMRDALLKALESRECRAAG